MGIKQIPQDEEFWRNVATKYHSAREAGRALGCHHTTIQTYLKKFGLNLLPKEVKIPPIQELKELIKDYGGIRPVARYLKVSHSAIYGHLDQHGLTLGDVMQEYQQEIAPLVTRESIYGDAIIIADCHNPFISLKWLDRVLYVAAKEHIHQLISAGDFFDFDRLSWWLQVMQAEDIAVKLEDELNLSEMVLERLEKQFTTIWMIGGNHWKRLLKKITYSISNKRLLGLVGRKDDPRYKDTGLFEWTLLDDKVRITHPAKARKLDYTLARDLSILHPSQWMLVAHRHRANEGFTPDGRPMWEIGWLGDVERMRYIQHVDSTYYNWINGFAFWKDGKLRNLTEFNYDWKD